MVLFCILYILLFLYKWIEGFTFETSIVQSKKQFILSYIYPY